MRTIWKWGLVYLEAFIHFAHSCIRRVGGSHSRLAHWWFDRIYSPFHYWNDEQEWR